MAPFPPFGLSRLVKQLPTGAPTAGSDCGVASVLNAILLASGGRVGPQTRADDKEWVAKVRRWADRPDGALFIRAHILRALGHEKLAELFRDVGLKPIDPEYHGAIEWSELKGTLAAGFPVVLALNYGVLRARGMAPTASNSFADGHALVLAGKKTIGGRVHTNDGDPLFDGRLIPGMAPARFLKGYQEVRLRHFRVAAARFGTTVHPGPGRACLVIIRGGIRATHGPGGGPFPAPPIDPGPFPAPPELPEDDGVYVGPAEPSMGVGLDEDDPDVSHDPVLDEQIDDDEPDDPDSPDD